MRKWLLKMVRGVAAESYQDQRQWWVRTLGAATDVAESARRHADHQKTVLRHAHEQLVEAWEAQSAAEHRAHAAEEALAQARTDLGELQTAYADVRGTLNQTEKERVLFRRQWRALVIDLLHPLAPDSWQRAELTERSDSDLERLLNLEWPRILPKGSRK